MFIKRILKYLNCFKFEENKAENPESQYMRGLIKAIVSNDKKMFSSSLDESLLDYSEKNTIAKKIIDYNRKDFISALSKNFITGLEKVDITEIFFKADQKKSKDALNELKGKIRKADKGRNLHDLIFEVKQGDLIYGCSKERGRVLIGTYKMPYPIVDFLNNEIIDMKKGKYYGKYYAKSSEAKKHAEYVEHHPRYNPYKIRRFETGSRDKRVKKLCKAGVTRILEGRQKKQIHFLLGDFDPFKAFLKKEKSIMFTNSEFRLIYREWLKNPKLVDEKIVFWTNSLKKVEPSSFFNSIGKKISYVPTSCRDKALLKMQKWANPKNDLNGELRNRNLSLD